MSSTLSSVTCGCLKVWLTHDGARVPGDDRGRECASSGAPDAKDVCTGKLLGPSVVTSRYQYDICNDFCNEKNGYFFKFGNITTVRRFRHVRFRHLQFRNLQVRRFHVLPIPRKSLNNINFTYSDAVVPSKTRVHSRGIG